MFGEDGGYRLRLDTEEPAAVTEGRVSKTKGMAKTNENFGRAV